MHVLVDLCMHTRCVVRGRTKQLAAGVSHPRFFQYSIHYSHAYTTPHTHTLPEVSPCAVGSNAKFIVEYYATESKNMRYKMGLWINDSMRLHSTP